MSESRRSSPTSEIFNAKIERDLGRRHRAAPRHPLSEYRLRRDARLADAAEWAAHERALSWSRLCIALAGLALLWPVLVTRALPLAWLALPATAFGLAVVVHDRVIRARRRAERAAACWDLAVARHEGGWIGRGSTGEAWVESAHPYGADLDLFGRGSLFERVNLARTRVGERTLAAWLCHPADPAEIRARHTAIGELAGRPDLREDLAVLGDESGSLVDPEALRAWAVAPVVRFSGSAPWVLGALGTINLVALALWATLPLGRPLFLVSATASLIVALVLRDRVLRVTREIARPEHQLELLAGMLARIERERFDSPRLSALRKALDGAGAAPSIRIRALARLVEIHESRSNMLFAPFAALTLAGSQLALAMERWRSASGPLVACWLEAVGEVEALVSLAAYADENREDLFPELVDRGPLLSADGLAHPLIESDRAVRNDVTLEATTRLLVVSGSNMSGKSTLLRAIGVNVALAQAGAPVRARAFKLSPLALGACLRVQDSLQEGTSRFYAEILRLRQIVALGSPDRPLLFLLDEILAGTNSHDRRLGAAAVLRSLLDRGGIGLVTTHDLALARIVDELAPIARNVHFEDRIDEGRIRFDYRLRPGVVERGNALELMRAIGLEV